MLETIAIFSNVQPQIQPHLFILVANIVFPRVEFEPSVSNKINKLGGANGTANLRNSAKPNNSTSYWTLNGRRCFWSILPRCIEIRWTLAFPAERNLCHRRERALIRGITL
jgi:hypothetical protein